MKTSREIAVEILSDYGVYYPHEPESSRYQCIYAGTNYVADDPCILADKIALAIDAENEPDYSDQDPGPVIDRDCDYWNRVR